VWGLVRAGTGGWTRPATITALALAVALLTAFAAWERRATAPMLPPALFRARTFTTASVTALIAYGGLFGALFVLGQLLVTGFGADPLHAGLGLLPMTAAMVLVAPVAGILSDRLGPRPLLCGALALEACALAWLALHAHAGAPYALLAPGLAAAGTGAAALFAPLQAAQLGAVEPARHGQASGAAITTREVGGVLGVAVVAGVFSAHGSTGSAHAFLAGARPALLVAAVAVAAALAGALALPRAGAAVAARPAPAADATPA
jgi:nitrate/nitrite transporter NarK